jgi:hypothetical protein
VQTAQELKLPVAPRPYRVPVDLFHVIRTQGNAGLLECLTPAVTALAPYVDTVVLCQFSLAPALSHLQELSPVPVLSTPHSSARRLKELLAPQRASSIPPRLLTQT